MTDNLPDYSGLEPPDDTPPEEYSTHERRAALLQQVLDAGSPFAITQAREAERFDVHESTISRDMDRLRESVDELLGQNAKLTTRAVYESIISELLEETDWKAKKAAWDIVMDWNEWLADLGEQHREPQRSEVDVQSRHSEVSYQVVREGDAEALPTTNDDASEDVDHDDLGFTSGPAEIDVTDPTAGGSGDE